MMLGILMVLCPEPYIVSMIGALGSVLLVFAILGVLEFLDSNRLMVDYMSLTWNLVVGIVGTAIIVFEVHSLYVVSLLFGVFLILTGILNFLNAFIYGKRSGRTGWWIMIILAMILVAFGIVILIHPNVTTLKSLFSQIGIILMISAPINILHLIWIWPIKGE